MKKGFEYLFLEFIKWGLEKKGVGYMRFIGCEIVPIIKKD